MKPRAAYRYCPLCASPLAPADSDGRPRSACTRGGCTFVNYDNPIPVVAAIVEHEGKILLARATGWPDKWFGLITGFLERGESPEEGIVREVREELGLTAVVKSLVGAYTFAERNELIVAYHVHAHGALELGAELEEVKAVARDRLRPWPFGTGLAVRDWLAREAH